MFYQAINEKLTLRMLKAREAKSLFHLIEAERDALRPWIPWVNQILNIEDALKFIQDSFTSYANRENLNCGIFLDRQLIGMVSFNHFDWHNHIGELGYWLKADQEGKGIMTMAVQTLIHHGFEQLALNKIEIFTAKDNLKSQGIPQRLNFTKEGIRRAAERINDSYVDYILFGLLSRERSNPGR